VDIPSNRINVETGAAPKSISLAFWVYLCHVGEEKVLILASHNGIRYQLEYSSFSLILVVCVCVLLCYFMTFGSAIIVEMSKRHITISHYDLAQPPGPFSIIDS
jgi:hypothetical protein